MNSTRDTNLRPLEGSLRNLGRDDAGPWERFRRELSDRAAAEGLVDVSFERHDSPLGPILLGATSTGLVRIGLPAEEEDAVLGELAERVSPRVLAGSRDSITLARRQLDQYFAGDRQSFDLSLDWQLTRGFRREVLRATALIPYGRTVSYREVATDAGRPGAFRAAGTALATNPLPIVVPCHRVLRSGGGLGDYRGGSRAKAWLLSLEGAACPLRYRPPPPMADAYIKPQLMTAGPTPLPPAVSQVMAEPIVYHRAPAFIEIYARCLAGLKRVFGTENDVLCFASSGSGAMESAVANLVRPGQPALVASCGKFGERWVELCQGFGAELVHHDAGWGSKVAPKDLDRLLGENPSVEVCFTTLSETSTGVVNDVAALAEVAGSHDVMLAVDAVSGLGAVPISQDEWGVDVVVSGSQKALMCPPGLGFASASERALRYAAERPGRRFYFDWEKTVKGQRNDPPDSPFTPAVTLFRALDVALGLIEEEGLERVLERHRLLGRAARAAVRGLELDLFGPEDEGANVVTAIRLPDGIDGAAVPKRMRDHYGITIAGGQGRLKGRIARIAHCGYFGAFDILTAVSALEMTLRELGADIELGAGAGAAQRVFVEAGEPALAPAAGAA